MEGEMGVLDPGEVGLWVDGWGGGMGSTKKKLTSFIRLR